METVDEPLKPCCWVRTSVLRAFLFYSEKHQIRRIVYFFSSTLTLKFREDRFWIQFYFLFFKSALLSLFLTISRMCSTYNVSFFFVSVITNMWLKFEACFIFGSRWASVWIFKVSCEGFCLLFLTFACCFFCLIHKHVLLYINERLDLVWKISPTPSAVVDLNQAAKLLGQ